MPINPDREEVIQVNIRIGRKELDAIDKARPSTVPRTHWIRGAIRRRLDQEASNVYIANEKEART